MLGSAYAPIARLIAMTDMAGAISCDKYVLTAKLAAVWDPVTVTIGIIIEEVIGNLTSVTTSCCETSTSRPR
jgi:hypothetical protein